MRPSSASLGRVLAKRRRRGDLANRVGVAGIAAGRMAVGGAVWLSPDRALRALGFDADAVELRTLARMAGTRDLALGAIQLAALRIGVAESRVSTATLAAVDAGDAAAFGLLLVSRERADRAAMIGLGSAAGAAVAGAWLGKRLR